MCDHTPRERAMVVTHEHDDGRPAVWCDPCLVPVIKALNDNGIPTRASCCGHNGRGSSGDLVDAPGWIDLADGRVLIIARDLAQAHQIEAAVIKEEGR